MADLHDQDQVSIPLLVPDVVDHQETTTENGREEIPESIGDENIGDRESAVSRTGLESNCGGSNEVERDDNEEMGSSIGDDGGEANTR